MIYLSKTTLFSTQLPLPPSLLNQTTEQTLLSGTPVEPLATTKTSSFSVLLASSVLLVISFLFKKVPTSLTS